MIMFTFTTDLHSSKKGAYMTFALNSDYLKLKTKNFEIIQYSQI